MKRGAIASAVLILSLLAGAAAAGATPPARGQDEQLARQAREIRHWLAEHPKIAVKIFQSLRRGEGKEAAEPAKRPPAAPQKMGRPQAGRRAEMMRRGQRGGWGLMRSARGGRGGPRMYRRRRMWRRGLWRRRGDLFRHRGWPMRGGPRAKMMPPGPGHEPPGRGQMPSPGWMSRPQQPRRVPPWTVQRPGERARQGTARRWPWAPPRGLPRPLAPGRQMRRPDRPAGPAERRRPERMERGRREDAQRGERAERERGREKLQEFAERLEHLKRQLQEKAEAMERREQELKRWAQRLEDRQRDRDRDRGRRPSRPGPREPRPER